MTKINFNDVDKLISLYQKAYKVFVEKNKINEKRRKRKNNK